MRKRVRVSYRSYRPSTAGASPWREPSCGRTVPFVRLSGTWLRRLGFPVGASVEVEAEPGRLVLRVVEPDPNPPAEPAAEAA